MQGISYIIPKFHERWSTNGLKLDRSSFPNVRKLCILLYCHASPTEISKRNSTKLCQWWTVNRV